MTRTQRKHEFKPINGIYEIKDETGNSWKVTISPVWNNKEIAGKYDVPSGNNSVEIENLFNKFIDLDIKIINQDSIKEYLVSYPDMLNIVETIGKKARKSLGRDTRLALTVYEEVNDNHLILYARNEKKDEEIDNLINKLQDTFSPLLRETQGWISIKKDYTIATLTEEEIKENEI